MIKNKNIQIVLFSIFIYCFTIPCAGKAQLVLQGKVSNSNGQPLVNVSVCILNGTQIVSYSISNFQGIYKIEIPQKITLDTSLYLQFSCIGYQRNILHLASNQKSSYDIQLISTVIQLPNVAVKSQPLLSIKGDTTNYNVNSFAQKQDRVIGDVIRRLPGIEIQTNGRILYNGKAISNFYIDDDDLLGDRYNIANNSIPVEMVEKVQVLENHQPIEALKNVQTSDNVSINLRLKNSGKLRLHGTANIGAGLPKKYEATANTLGFFKRQKFINTIATNNTGFNIKDETVQLNYRDFLTQIEKEEVSRMLSPEAVNHLPINQNKYFNNKSLLVNFNELIKLKSGIQLKANLFYLPEKIIQRQTTEAIIYILADTIHYKEKQQSDSKLHQSFGDLQLNINKPRFYANNKFSFQNNNSTINTLAQRSTDTIHQYYTDKSISFANDFSILKLLKNRHIIEFFSYISFARHPETIDWRQGIFANILNDSTAYLNTNQSLILPTFFTNNYLSYRYKFSKYFLQSYQIGYSHQHQKLESDIGLLQSNNIYKNAADSFANHFIWNKSKAYLNIISDWQKNNLKINVKMPLSYLQFNIPQNKINKFALNPQLKARYEVSNENSLVANLLTNTTFGNIQSLYKGYIIQNYRNIAANNGLNSILREEKSKSISLGFNYKRSAKIFFTNFLLGYSSLNSNVITENEVSVSLNRKTLHPFNNTVKNLWLNIGFSKYLFKYGTTVSAKLNLQNTTMNQFLNGTLQLLLGNTEVLSITASYKKNSWFSIVYSSNFANSVSKFKNISNRDKQQLFQFQQNIESYFFPVKKFIASINVEQFYSYNLTQKIKTNVYFADISIRYKLTKIKAETELSCTNIFDRKEFANSVLFGTTLTETRIALNPRILLLKCFFTF